MTLETAFDIIVSDIAAGEHTPRTVAPLLTPTPIGCELSVDRLTGLGTALHGYVAEETGHEQADSCHASPPGPCILPRARAGVFKH